MSRYTFPSDIPEVKAVVQIQLPDGDIIEGMVMERRVIKETDRPQFKMTGLEGWIFKSADDGWKHRTDKVELYVVRTPSRRPPQAP